ncbi:hypothetical protein [Actinoallomurus sp. NPDC050550]|uniref:hypothetical protein n=1 Tax=Actinoallomurus sp. NPDC050550 TaxID=3154937 RepID=UPI00340800CF
MAGNFAGLLRHAEQRVKRHDQMDLARETGVRRRPGPWRPGTEMIGIGVFAEPGPIAPARIIWPCRPTYVPRFSAATHVIRL